MSLPHRYTCCHCQGTFASQRSLSLHLEHMSECSKAYDSNTGSKKQKTAKDSSHDELSVPNDQVETSPFQDSRVAHGHSADSTESCEEEGGCVLEIVGTNVPRLDSNPGPPRADIPVTPSELRHTTDRHRTDIGIRHTDIGVRIVELEDTDQKEIRSEGSRSTNCFSLL